MASSAGAFAEAVTDIDGVIALNMRLMVIVVVIFALDLAPPHGRGIAKAHK